MCHATSTLPLLQKEKRREVTSGGDGVGEGRRGKGEGREIYGRAPKNEWWRGNELQINRKDLHFVRQLTAKDRKRN